jgi:hypothetical protein
VQVVQQCKAARTRGAAGGPEDGTSNRGALRRQMCQGARRVWMRDGGVCKAQMVVQNAVMGALHAKKHFANDALLKAFCQRRDSNP